LQSAKIAFTGTAREEGGISIVHLEPGVSQAIKSFLADKGIQQPIRIDLHFSGCCDASLGLCVDTILETDLSLELDGLTFVISPEIYQLAGKVIISYVDEIGRKGFVLTSSKPISEWDGFAVGDIKI
jgi:Fe-S cluster assembly iron-binding protein IscA